MSSTFVVLASFDRTADQFLGMALTLEDARAIRETFHRENRPDFKVGIYEVPVGRRFHDLSKRLVEEK